MFDRVKIALSLTLAVALGGLFPTTVAEAAAPVQTYSFDWQVYPTREAAEAAMRAAVPAGDLLVQVDSHVRPMPVGPDGIKRDVLTLVYGIPDQPPEKIFASEYSYGGWNVQAFASVGFPCTPAVLAPANGQTPAVLSEWCGNESEMVEAKHAYMRSAYPSCTMSESGSGGSYAEPFSSVTAYSSGDGRGGVIGHGMVIDPHSPINRHGKFKLDCSGGPTLHATPTPRNEQFRCRLGLKAKQGEAPGFDVGVHGKDITWPLLCEQTQRWIIETIVTQTDTCKVGNPCHPATGDKSRAETDFQFAGRSFTRHYHSLRQFQDVNGPANGWTHTFSERLAETAGYRYLLSGEGYFESLVDLGGGRYRLANSSDRIFEAVSAGDVAWRLTSGSEIREFNAAGRLIAIRDPSQPAGDVELVYAGDALTMVVDSQGRALRFEYAAGLMSKILLPDGGSVSYGYDANANLTSVDYGAGAVRQYHYNEAGLSHPGQVHHLTGITLETGARYGTFGYDVYGRVISSGLNGGSQLVDKTAISYTSDTTAVVTTDAEGTRTFTYEPGTYRRQLSVSDSRGAASSTYFADGRVKTRTGVDGVTTAYEYTDSYQSAVTEAVGTPQERRTTTVRDAGQRLTRREVRGLRNGVQTLLRVDAYAYDAGGRQTAACAIDPDVAGATGYTCGSAANAPTGVRQTRSSYCDAAGVSAGTCPSVGLLTSVDGARTDVSDVTTYTYRAADDAACAAAPTTCAYRKGDLWKVTNALGQVSEVLKYDGAGRVLSSKDVNGVTTDRVYNARGWLEYSKVRGTDVASEADDAITRLEYYRDGKLYRTRPPGGAPTTFSYTYARFLYLIKDNEGNSLRYVLDAAGRRKQEVVEDQSLVLLRNLTRTYDALGRMLTQKDAYNRVTTFTHDGNGNTDTVTDALSRVSDNDYDVLDRLRQTVQDVGGIAATTQFGYDAQDNLTSVVDPKGLTTGYQYNGLGDLVKLTSPDTGETTYTYDSAGNRKTQTDARGITTTYGYDAVNRLASVSYADTTLNVSYTFDTNQAVCTGTEAFSKGRLTRFTDISGSTTYCYDRFGRMVRKAQVTNGITYTTRYGYNLAGQLTSMTYPGGMAVDYVRDTMGRTTEVGVTPSGSPRQVLIREATYYPFGPAAEWVYGNGRLMQRTLNSNYQPGIIRDGTADGISLGYEFDEVGNLKTLRAEDQLDPPLRHFGYDDLNRLTETRDGGTNAVLESYAYDATGNRTSAVDAGISKAYVTAADSHRLSSVGGVVRGYDAAGNTTSIGGSAKQFIYNAVGRMTQVKQGTTVVMNYTYNGKGEQVRRFTGPGSTTYVYDEAGQWLGAHDGTGAPLQQVIWLDNLPIGLWTNNQLHYIEPDALGTPRVVVDPVRNLAVWRWNLVLEAFGKDAPSQDPDADGTPFVFDLRFPGQRYDAVTGFNYNYFRDYDAGAGRYVQSDPLGLLGGLALYGYSAGAPLTLTDRYGLTPENETCRGPSCAPSKKRYPTQRAAARAMLKAVNPVSVHFNLEVCGNICKDNAAGAYFLPGAIVGTLDGCRPSAAPGCPSCSTRVAYWHTHGAFTDSDGDGFDDYDSENFSTGRAPSDTAYADSQRIDAYLATPSSQFWGYAHGSGNPVHHGGL